MELINQVLDLAQIETGHIALSLGKIQVEKVCLECLSLIERQAKQRGLNIISDLNATYFINVDYTRFKQVLINLLSNAVKYNNEGGSLTLASNNTADNCIRISVTDTGVNVTNNRHGSLYRR